MYFDYIDEFDLKKEMLGTLYFLFPSMMTLYLRIEMWSIDIV
jgi:hypothetical protein